MNQEQLKDMREWTGIHIMGWKAVSGQHGFPLWQGGPIHNRPAWCPDYNGEHTVMLLDKFRDVQMSKDRDLGWEVRVWKRNPAYMCGPGAEPKWFKGESGYQETIGLAALIAVCDAMGYEYDS